MANLQQYNYPGWGEFAKKNNSYSQAVRVENRILCSGQGGWDGSAKDFDLTNLVPNDLRTEIHQAFANVERNLKHAGGQGWSQVYKVVTYSTDIAPQHEFIVANLREWMPGHGAVWTEVGVSYLGAPSMRFEIEVEAYDPEGAAKARA